MDYYICNKSSIIDVRLGYIKASENFEISKPKVRYSKSSRLLQRIAFSCLVNCFELFNFLMRLILFLKMKSLIALSMVLNTIHTWC